MLFACPSLHINTSLHFFNREVLDKSPNLICCSVSGEMSLGREAERSREGDKAVKRLCTSELGRSECELERKPCDYC